MDPHAVSDLAQLEALYAEPSALVRNKVAARLDAPTRAFMAASPFVLLATSGDHGPHVTPRGDGPGFVEALDDGTIALPDRRGNNRLDTLRNIVVDGRVGLLFLVPGVGVTLRVNGTAELSTDDALRESFAVRGTAPRSVIVVRTTAVYTQCPKALVRSHLWDPARFRDAADLPTVGQITAAVSAGRFGGPEYDRTYPERLARTLY